MSIADVEGTPRKVRSFEAIVSGVIRETPDSTTLVFSTPSGRPDYLAGQFLTIRPHQFPEIAGFVAFLEERKGKKEPARAYSMYSAPHEADIAVTIKEEPFVPGTTKYPPLLSPLLTYGIAPGRQMTVTGFGGPYVLPADIETLTDHVVHLCAGSGIVPNLSILKHALSTGLRLRHTLIYGNKTWADIIFRREIEELAAAHPEKLRVVHAVSREANPERLGPHVRAGRIGLDLVRELIPEPKAVQVFACGPAIGKFDRLAAKERGVEPSPRFMETALEALREIGVPRESTHFESYG